MTPPRDPDSGKGRVPYVDYSMREVTRPGVHVEPRQPCEDFADEPTPIREFHRLEQRVANVEAVAIEAKIRLEQADSLPSTEWAREIDKRIAATSADVTEKLDGIEADATAGGDIARAIKRIKALAWGALGTALVGLGSALWFALGVAKASGVSEGVERVREEQRIEAAKRLTAVEEAQAKLSRELSRVLGILDGSRPYRAAPYLGPTAPDQEP